MCNKRISNVQVDNIPYDNTQKTISYLYERKPHVSYCIRQPEGRPPNVSLISSCRSKRGQKPIKFNLKTIHKILWGQKVLTLTGFEPATSGARARGLNRSAKWAIKQSVRTHMLFPLA